MESIKPVRPSSTKNQLNPDLVKTNKVSRKGTR